MDLTAAEPSGKTADYSLKSIPAGNLLPESTGTIVARDQRYVNGFRASVVKFQIAAAIAHAHRPGAVGAVVTAAGRAVHRVAERYLSAANRTFHTDILRGAV